MNFGLRDHLADLRRQGMLLDVEEAIDLRYASALIARAGKAVCFLHPQGYEPQVLVGGLYSDRDRAAVAYGCPFEDAWKRARKAEAEPVPPIIVDPPAWDVVAQGDAVDLTELPIPVLATRDGAPYLSAAITGVRDPAGGNNWGVYRYQLADRRTLHIDLTSFNHLHMYLQRAFDQGKTLGVTVCLGNHPAEFIAAAANLPPGVDEMGFAGALRGEPVELVQGATVDALGIANSEILLEGEFLPGGWAHDEGRFGEFHGLMGSMHKNPALRIHRVARRRDSHLYALQMAGECHYLYIPLTEWAARKALQAAGIQVTAVNVTVGGGAAFHVIASIKKYPGAGKHAILALMNVGIVKHVVVTDDDINVFDLQEVEWAIATRVQADKDVVIIPGMGRAKPLDPVIPPGMDPMLITRMGIDATIPEGIPRSRYDRIVYPHFADLRMDDLLGQFRSAYESPAPARDLDSVILEHLRASGPLYYVQILDHHAAHPHRALVQALGRLWEEGRLERDGDGRYLAAN